MQETCLWPHTGQTSGFQFPISVADQQQDGQKRKLGTNAPSSKRGKLCVPEPDIANLDATDPKRVTQIWKFVSIEYLWGITLSSYTLLSCFLRFQALEEPAVV